MRKLFICVVAVIALSSTSVENYKQPHRKTCSYLHHADFLLVYKDKKRISPPVTVSLNETLNLRCSNISQHFLRGTNTITCGEKGWIGVFSTCVVLKPGDTDGPPVVAYTVQNGKYHIAQNGSLVVEEYASLKLGCWWFRFKYSKLPTWTWKQSTLPSDAKTKWILEAYYELSLDEINKGHEGRYDCVIPKGFKHGIDVRVMKNGIKRSTTTPTAIPTTILTTEQNRYYDCRVNELENGYVTSKGKMLKVGNYVQHGTTIITHCKNGFEIASNSLLSINAMDSSCLNGNWSNLINCTPARCFLSDINKLKLTERNLQLVDTIEDVISSDSKLSLECQGDNSTEKQAEIFLQCYVGIWIYPENCSYACSKKSDAVYCTVLKSLYAHVSENGHMLADGSLVQHGLTILLTCDAGYEVSSTSSSLETTAVVSCNNGQWSQPTDCVPPRCLTSSFNEKQLKILNMKLPSNLKNAVANGTKILLDCLESHQEREKDYFLECHNGYWVYPTPNYDERCMKKSCNISTLTLQFGKISVDWKEIDPQKVQKISHGTELQLECTQRGYDLYTNSTDVSNELVRCLDGMLTPAKFECKPGRCKCSDLNQTMGLKGMEILSCRSIYVESGEKEQLKCRPGLPGPKEPFDVICNHSIWYTNIKCTDRCDCSEMNLDRSLQIEGFCHGKAQNGDKFILNCAVDYGNIEGDNRLVECRAGHWYIPKARCRASCDSPDIQNGIVKALSGRGYSEVQPLTKIGDGNQIMVECKDQYKLDPLLESINGRISCTDGIFYGLPRCIPEDIVTVVSDGDDDDTDFWEKVKESEEVSREGD